VADVIGPSATVSASPVPVPAGVEHVSEWERDEPTPRRHISAENHGVQGHDLIVDRLVGRHTVRRRQHRRDRDAPTVRVDGLFWERGLSSTQARELARPANQRRRRD
jgi:hypothetical protein